MQSPSREKKMKLRISATGLVLLLYIMFWIVFLSYNERLVIRAIDSIGTANALILSTILLILNAYVQGKLLLLYQNHLISLGSYAVASFPVALVWVLSFYVLPRAVAKILNIDITFAVIIISRIITVSALIIAITFLIKRFTQQKRKPVANGLAS
ncbi:hypothetical protein QPL79_06425 [Ignisphaera sp. 4213-co]|uniref:Permease n=1 Tax=Ignisphaera cupida TaxID=3050454 RepID=A0ABD4Z7Z5_9CREN|nr:hypothetical protein [Ignisphaera sp. 4213-co]MDK6028995.1 hypothetical protein [Ignisphaera sp. 4213-co]